MRVLASSLDHLASLGYSIKFLACQRGEVDDHSTSQSIVRMMRYPANILPWTSDPQKIADAFGAASLVVAMRLHAAVLAEAYGVPCVTMPYDAKVTEYSERAGHAGLRIFQGQAENRNVVEVVSELADNLSEPGVPVVAIFS